MPGFAIRLDHQSGVPIYRQIIQQILYAVARGELAVGAQLPTVRQLAVELSVNPNTVVKAYKELELRGSLESQQGTGTFVRSAEVEIAPGERRRMLQGLCRDLVARAGAYGIEIDEIVEALEDFRRQPAAAASGTGGERT